MSATWLPAAPNQSRSVPVAIGLVVAVETMALHLWLHRSHPYLAWSLTAPSVLMIGWLVLDYRALAVAGVSVGPSGCDVRIGRRVRAEFPWAAVESVRLASWRDLPLPGRDYLNAARPDDPNLLFVFRAPLAVAGPLGRRRIRQLGLRLVDPGPLVGSWNERRGPAS